MLTNVKIGIYVELMLNALTLMEAISAIVSPAMKRLNSRLKVDAKTRMNACLVDSRVEQTQNVSIQTEDSNVYVRTGLLETRQSVVNVS